MMIWDDLDKIWKKNKAWRWAIFRSVELYPWLAGEVVKFNLADKMEEVIRFKTNDQLNQFSRMYFNKMI